jgi:hypothetical protein
MHASWYHTVCRNRYWAHLLSDTRLGNINLSTAFQFAWLVLVSVSVNGHYEPSYRFTHLTNADIKVPMMGLTASAKLGYVLTRDNLD